MPTVRQPVTPRRESRSRSWVRRPPPCPDCLPCFAARTSVLWRLLQVILAGAGLLLLLLLLSVGNYQCPIRRILGFDCPSCGLTRAAQSLLRLDFAGAFGYNPTIYPLVALLLAMGVEHLWRGLTPRRMLRYALIYLGIAVSVWIVGIALSVYPLGTL